MCERTRVPYTDLSLKRARKAGIINWNFVNQCWDLKEREYQYLAQDYLIALKKHLQKHDLEKIQELIIKKSCGTQSMPLPIIILCIHSV